MTEASMPLQLPWDSSLSSLAFYCFTAFSSYYVLFAIDNLYFHPLSKYPGPFWAKISGVPSFYQAVTGNRYIWLWQCHQIYGDAVRFKPNGLSFNSASAYKSIYSAKPPLKRGKLYETFPRNEAGRNTASTIEIPEHARKRRVLNTVFSDKTVRSAEQFIIKHVDRWCEIRLDGPDKEWSEPELASDLADQLMFDVMGDLSFGRSFDIKERKENPFRDMPHIVSGFVKYLYVVGFSPFVNTWVWLKPRGLNGLLEYFAPPNVLRFHEFIDKSLTLRAKLEKTVKGGPNEENGVRNDIFHYLFRAKDPENAVPYSWEDLSAEANLLVVAGSDTSSVVLSGFFFYLTRYPRVYAKLCSEIREKFDTMEEIKGGPKLSASQYLRACIDETLRMCPATPGELPRVVQSPGLEVDGSFVPVGVQVGVPLWPLQHKQEYFGDPFIFRPERWIVDEAAGVTPEDVSLAQSAFFPFSSGSYNCVGQRLAIIELMIIIARMLYVMDFRLQSGDRLGEGSPELGWGRRDKKIFQVRDFYVGQRKGPMVQFRKREF